MQTVFKTLVIAVISGAIGIGLGLVQASINNGSHQERFLGTRTTTAVVRGELSEDAELIPTIGKPKVEVVGGTDFDFGMMLHGESMSHSFTFRNVGDAPLILEMGGSTCKCTVGDLEESVLEPGEETEVKLTWKAQALTRKFGQTATILTNDSENLEVKLQVMGKIAQSFVMEPPAMELGSFSDTETIQRTFHIFTYLDDAELLKNFEWTDSKTRDLVHFDVKQVELDAAEFPDHANALVVHQVDVTIDPGLPIGPLSSRVEFETDQGEAVGHIGLPITGTVVGQLELRGGPSFDPRYNLVKIGNVDSSKGASVSVFLFIQGENHQDIVPEIESVLPAEALQVTLGTPKVSESKSIYPLRFEVPKGAPEVYYPATGGKNNGRVLIRTRGAVTTELPINVRLIVRD